MDWGKTWKMGERMEAERASEAYDRAGKASPYDFEKEAGNLRPEEER